MRSICFSLLLLSLTQSIVQEYLKPPVALVNDDFSLDIGTAFLVGEDETYLYWVTARHGVKNIEEIILKLLDNQTLSAEVVDCIGHSLDLVPLKAPKPVNWKPLTSFALAKRSPIVDQPLMLVGHPDGFLWKLNRRTHLIQLHVSFDDRLFTLSTEGIARGNSGGPVLNQQDELVGMVYSVGNIRSEAIQAEALVEILRGACRIPLNLLTGVARNLDTGQKEEDAVVRQFIQEGNTSFQAGYWKQAKKAYDAAYERQPSQELKARILECQAEIGRDLDAISNICSLWRRPLIPR
jgi:hypothetical protein